MIFEEKDIREGKLTDFPSSLFVLSGI